MVCNNYNKKTFILGQNSEKNNHTFIGALIMASSASK